MGRFETPKLVTRLAVGHCLGQVLAGASLGGGLTLGLTDVCHSISCPVLDHTPQQLPHALWGAFLLSSKGPPMTEKAEQVLEYHAGHSS